MSRYCERGNRLSGYLKGGAFFLMDERLSVSEGVFPVQFSYDVRKFHPWFSCCEAKDG
jgi:hypothetical protein